MEITIAITARSTLTGSGKIVRSHFRVKYKRPKLFAMLPKKKKQHKKQNQKTKKNPLKHNYTKNVNMSEHTTWFPNLHV